MNATTFGALAEPYRLDIVELLRDGPSPSKKWTPGWNHSDASGTRDLIT